MNLQIGKKKTKGGAAAARQVTTGRSLAKRFGVMPVVLVLALTTACSPGDDTTAAVKAGGTSDPAVQVQAAPLNKVASSEDTDPWIRHDLKVTNNGTVPVEIERPNGGEYFGRGAQLVVVVGNCGLSFPIAEEQDQRGVSCTAIAYSPIIVQPGASETVTSVALYKDRAAICIGQPCGHDLPIQANAELREALTPASDEEVLELADSIRDHPDTARALKNYAKWEPDAYTGVPPQITRAIQSAGLSRDSSNLDGPF